MALVPDLGVTPLPDLVLRPLRPSLERRGFAAARAGSDDHPLIRAVVDSLIPWGAGDRHRGFRDLLSDCGAW